MRNLEESFKDYIQVETLEGENKYQAEGYGLQDAKKGVIFEKFPPVLHLQLRRFEYDMEKDAMCKVSAMRAVSCERGALMGHMFGVDQRSSRVPLRHRPCPIPRQRIHRPKHPPELQASRCPRPFRRPERRALLCPDQAGEGGEVVQVR